MANQKNRAKCVTVQLKDELLHILHIEIWQKFYKIGRKTKERVKVSFVKAMC